MPDYVNESSVGKVSVSSERKKSIINIKNKRLENLNITVKLQTIIMVKLN